MPGHGANPLEHVLDHQELEIPWVTPPRFELKIHLPQVFGLQITRFMVMELVAAVLVIVVVVPVVQHISRNYVSRGRFANMIEAMLLFIRDDVARPAIGGHAADRFLPYLWTVFFFVLFNNLLGMFPGGASPTGNI
ncbi:MAG TPA: F0F1 ATP synthase subunit A, partial [Candidatus Acidoferrum sp.]|nr:F0F1 ATP synthase subunit A [Candidatus Acidoferrum sp.]